MQSERRRNPPPLGGGGCQDLEKLIGSEGQFFGAEKYGPHGFLEKLCDDSPVYKKAPLQDGLAIIPVSSSIVCTAFVIAKTALIAVDEIFPECSLLTKSTRTPRMICVANPLVCTVGVDCVGKLLNRLGSICQVHDSWELFVLYWAVPRKENPKQKRLMGLVVETATSNMRLIVMNPHALDDIISRRATRYQIEF